MVNTLYFDKKVIKDFRNAINKAPIFAQKNEYKLLYNGWIWNNIKYNKPNW